MVYLLIINGGLKMNHEYLESIDFENICLLLKSLGVTYSKIALDMNQDLRTINRWRKQKFPSSTLTDGQYKNLFKLIAYGCKTKNLNYSEYLSSFYPELKNHSTILNDTCKINELIRNSLDYHINNKKKGKQNNAEDISSYIFSNDLKKITADANKGIPSAMYELGMMHYHGIASADTNTSRWDYEKATYWLKRVTESNDEELRCHAFTTLGRMYYGGLVPREPQSYEKSLQCYQAAETHDAYSVASIGFMLREGIGCEFDLQNVLTYYRNNYHQQDDMTNLELARFLTKYGRFKESLEIYKSIVNKSPEVYYQMGLLYRNGVANDPPKPDCDKAALCFKIAADNNNHHIQAAYEYGILCFRPMGQFPKNFLDAEKYLKIAADGGHPTAQYVLGYMLKNGHTRKDLSLAIKYLEMARAQSHTLAAYELASIYQQPECQDYSKAYECAEIAALHGSPDGSLILGNLLFLGRGCAQDINRAYMMYDIAAKHGMYYASVMKNKIEKMLSF